MVGSEDDGSSLHGSYLNSIFLVRVQSLNNTLRSSEALDDLDVLDVSTSTIGFDDGNELGLGNFEIHIVFRLGAVGVGHSNNLK